MSTVSTYINMFYLNKKVGLYSPKGEDPVIIPVVLENSYVSGYGPNHSVWIRGREVSLGDKCQLLSSEYINSAALLNLCPSILSSRNRDGYVYS